MAHRLSSLLLLLHGGGLASAVVSKERGDLTLIEVQVEVLHCNFPIGINLVEVFDGHTLGYL